MPAQNMGNMMIKRVSEVVMAQANAVLNANQILVSPRIDLMQSVRTERVLADPRPDVSTMVSYMNEMSRS